MFRHQEVIHSNVQLPVQWLEPNDVFATYLDGEPCIVVAGWGKGSGVYLRHAVTLSELRSLQYKEFVCCVCVHATGRVFFGTESG